MPGAVPLNDLPDSLRGRTVPADDLPGPAAAPPALPALKPLQPTPEAQNRTAAFRGAMSIPGMGLLQRAAEGAWNLGAKVPAGYAGLLGTALGGPEMGERWTRGVQGALSVEPAPDELISDPLYRGVAAGAEKFSELLAPAEQRLTSTPLGETLVPALGEAAGDLSVFLPGGALARGPLLANRAARETIRESERLMGGRVAPGTTPLGPGSPTYLSTPAASVSRAGITVTPGEVQRQVAGSGEKVTGARRAEFGTGAVNRDVAMGNAPRINEIAIQGMPDGIKLDPRNKRIEQPTVDAAKQTEFAKYQAVRGVPGDGASPELVASLDQVAAGLADATEEVAGKVQRLLAQKAAGGNSNKLVEDIMALRQEAVMDGKRAFNTNDPDARQLARYKRQIADHLEEELARRGDAAGLVGVRETLKEARTNLAKINTLEEALDQGFVDAARLEKVTEGGGYLSDGLAQLSEFNQATPISLTHPQRIATVTDPNLRAGANPKDVALRSAQFMGGNFLTRLIGKSGVNALNEELRGFRVPDAPPRAEIPPFSFERAPEVPPVVPEPPQAPPGLTASTPPAPRTPDMPDAGRPDAAPFNQLLAERMAGDLTLEGQMPPAPPTSAPFLRPTDVVDFEPPVAPPVQRQALPPITQDQLRLAPDMPLSMAEERPLSLAAMLDERVPLTAEGLGRGIDTDFASQLGPVRDPLVVPDESLPLQIPPRGISQAQIAFPPQPRGLELLPDEGPLPPTGPRFGAADEFPGPALSLADDLGPASSRFDVTEAGPREAGAFPGRYQVPGTQRLETPQGYITYRDMGDRWQVNDAYTLPRERGKGFGQQQLLNLARKAQDAGKRLDSDVKVSADQRRVYVKLKERGLLDYEESPNGGPVFRNIRPTGGISDQLGP